jgi:hypothetical protein
LKLFHQKEVGMLSHDQVFESLRKIDELIEQNRIMEFVEVGKQTNHPVDDLDFYGLPYIVTITDKNKVLLAWPQYDEVKGFAQICGYKFMLLNDKDDLSKVLTEKQLDSNFFPKKASYNSVSHHLIKKAIANEIEEYPEVAEYIFKPILVPWKAPKILPIYEVVAKRSPYFEGDDEKAIVFYLDTILPKRATYDEFMQEVQGV